MELLKKKVQDSLKLKDLFWEEDFIIIKMETELNARKQFISWLKNISLISESHKILNIKFALPVSSELNDLQKQQGIIEGLNDASEYFRNEGFFCEQWTDESSTNLKVSFIPHNDIKKIDSEPTNDLIDEMFNEPFGLSLTMEPVFNLFKIMCCKYKEEDFEHPSYDLFKKHLLNYLKVNYQDYYKEIQSTYSENKDIQKDLMFFALYKPLLCHDGDSLTLMQAAQLERINEIKFGES